MTDGYVLVLNAGSSSIKFALVGPDEDAFPLEGVAERLHSPEAVLRWQRQGEAHESALSGADHRAALAALLPLVTTATDRLQAVGHRVVHGGETFRAACRIDADTLAAIRANEHLAPLHNPANLQGIEAARALFPDLPQVAVFDTAFHQTLPPMAFRYAVPAALYHEHGVRRYGFHGTSHQYVSLQAARQAQLPVEDSSWLVAHLGNGCSACAVVNGHSRDTSMGLTPLEGLVMGTRSGDVDPNLHSHLQRRLGWSLTDIDKLLNQDSGLLGLSGLSNDMRSLEAAREQGHAGAQLAIEVFCYRLAKQLAALSCALPRLDGLVFTGGIGENSALVRALTVAHLGLLGLQLAADTNIRCVRGRQGRIDSGTGPAIWVIPTSEERQIARETRQLLDEHR